VLVSDPANLVAAKSLADIHLGRNDNLEALKKFKLYRAISGDRKVDEMIAKLEPLVAPKPVTPVRRAPEPPPPPPKFQETDNKSKRRSVPRAAASSPETAPLGDAFEITPLSFELGDDSGAGKSEDPFPFVPTRDVSLAVPLFAPPPAPPLPVEQSLWLPASPAPEPPPPAAAWNPAPAPVEASPEPPVPPRPEPASDVSPEPRSEASPEAAAEPVRPSGRALADLYFAQGHYAEALQIYDDLVVRHPFDEDLKRMRRDAEARLLPASTSPAAAAPDVGLERRLARIRALKQWLSVVQAG
jgi:hypothetical protein